MGYPFDPEEPLPVPLSTGAAAAVLEERRALLPEWIDASRALVVRLGELSRWEPPELLLESPSHGLIHMSTISSCGDLTPFEMIGYEPSTCF